jgi:hypothetical protein
MSGIKLDENEFNRLVNENMPEPEDEIPSSEEDLLGNDKTFIEGLDSFEFTWDVDHPLRKFYTRLKKQMYAKYACDDHDNVDLTILVDEILELKTQLYGVGRLSLKLSDRPKNFAYRVKEHRKTLRENLLLLMKYTRKEPEKSLKKTVSTKGKDLASKLTSRMTDDERVKIAKAIKDVVRQKYVTSPDEEAPFTDNDDKDDDD